MSILLLVGIGLAILILTIGIYFVTRRLAMRATYGPQASAGRGYEAATEPLYETPMPRKAVITEEPASKNPLVEIIEEWEEPESPRKPETLPESKTERKTRTKMKAADKPERKPGKKVRRRETSTDARENPWVKFIEEWEEPKPEDDAGK